jgi:hypothetical protein
MAAPNGKKPAVSPVPQQIATALGETKPMSLEERRQVWFYQVRTKAAQQTEQQATD